MIGRVSISAIFLVISALPAEADYDHSHRQATPNGPAYLLPKHLSIYPFDLSANPVYGKEGGSLIIDKNGQAKLYLPHLKNGSLKNLDKESAFQLLGKCDGPTGEDDNNPYYWTFDVITFHPSGHNLYHIDAQFVDKEKHWKSYRVRGYQVVPDWHTVSDDQAPPLTKPGSTREQN